jgi:hypothetical protein
MPALTHKGPCPTCTHNSAYLHLLILEVATCVPLLQEHHAETKLPQTPAL